MPPQKKAPSNLYIPHNTDSLRYSSGSDDLSLHSDIESDEEEYLDSSGVEIEDIHHNDRLAGLEKRIRELETQRWRARDEKDDKSDKRSSVRDFDDANTAGVRDFDIEKRTSMRSYNDDKRTSMRDIDIERLPRTPADAEKGKTSSAYAPPLSAGFGFHAPPMRDTQLVEWDGPEDPENPKNWSFMYKCWMTATLSIMTLVVTFNSSIYSTALPDLSHRFGVSAEVVTLGTSFTVLGFAFGPVIFGPLSELYGRKLPLFAGYIPFIIFQIPEAVAGNLETVLLARFFGGFFGSAPLAVVGGSFGDIWGIIPRSVAIVIYGSAVFLGPVFGPVVGGFIVHSDLGWRWTAWITAIFGLVVGLICLFTCKESYEPLLLQNKAAKLRYQTKNWALHSKLDEQPVTMDLIVKKYLVRVFVMLVKEPILVLITVYISLIYGIIYLLFSAFPIAFAQQRGWKGGVANLPFLALVVGALLAGAYISWDVFTNFRKKLLAGTNTPEDRLPTMIVGGLAMPIGLFWFAWTSDPSISWVPQVIAAVPIGFGIVCIFMQGFNYIIDCYMMNANSALAANTLMRSCFGAGFPLFSVQMYHKLGVDWATSLLGFLCAAMIPIPVVFWFYGKKIRGWSKFVPSV